MLTEHEQIMEQTLMKIESHLRHSIDLHLRPEMLAWAAGLITRDEARVKQGLPQKGGAEGAEMLDPEKGEAIRDQQAQTFRDYTAVCDSLVRLRRKGSG